jgi:tetratricopeptide (TPR) repeat protein
MSQSENLVDKLFLDLCNKLKDFDKPLNENFVKLANHFDRFKFMWCMGFIHKEVDKLFEPTNFKPKDNQVSKEFRREGNELYKEKRFSEAILKYNESIRYAPCKPPHDETENQLALAYGNRSAVYFQMDEFRLSLSDLEQAIRFGYPNDLKHKLVERKFNCLIRLEAYNELNEFVKQEKITITPSLLEQIRVNLGDWDEFRLDNEDGERVFKNYADINFEIKHRNTRCSNASKSITIDYKILSGLSLKAVEDINVGDLLVEESPYASVLLSENIESHCLECMVPLNHLKMNLAYCRQCSLVSYCSARCEKKGWHGHHKYECSRFNLLAFQSGLTHMEWLSLRIVLKVN